VRTFANWLIRRGTLRDNPVRQVRMPPVPPPRTIFLETADAIRLAEAQPSPYREFSALLAGSGIEVSVALELRRRDVDKQHREIRAKGTKTHARDRVVRVAEWAWPYIVPLLKGKHDDDYLFETIPDRWIAADHHRAAIEKLVNGAPADGDRPEVKGSPVFKGYTMRDHRHTSAVRAARAGVPFEIIAQQLGHVDSTLVSKVYGRFKPRQDERDKWEKIAAAADAERTKDRTDSGPADESDEDSGPAPTQQVMT
jgi:integrase